MDVLPLWDAERRRPWVMSVAHVQWGFQWCLLALFGTNLWALVAPSDAKPLALELRLGRAGESALGVSARDTSDPFARAASVPHLAWECGESDRARLSGIGRERLGSDPFCGAGGAQGRRKKPESVTWFLAVDWNALLAP